MLRDTFDRLDKGLKGVGKWVNAYPAWAFFVHLSLSFGLIGSGPDCLGPLGLIWFLAPWIALMLTPYVGQWGYDQRRLIWFGAWFIVVVVIPIIWWPGFKSFHSGVTHMLLEETGQAWRLGGYIFWCLMFPWWALAWALYQQAHRH